MEGVDLDFCFCILDMGTE